MKSIIFLFGLAWICQNVEAIGYTYPKGIINKLVNDTLKIVCTINLNSTLSEGKNSSYLSFSNKIGPVPDSYVQILNETSIALTIPNVQAMNDIFTCYLDKIHGVSFNEVFVGYKPSKVHNFKCRSQNWMNMNCTFESPYNPVVPQYSLQYHLGPKNMKSINDCPLDGLHRQYWCFIDFDKGSYRQSYDLYYFTLYSRNAFGNFTESFLIKNYESVIPAAPERLETLNITSRSAFIKWKIPYQLTTFPRNLTHEVKYMSDIDGEWIALPSINDKNITHVIQLDNLEYAFVWYDVRVRIKVDGAPNLEEMWSDYARKIFQTDSRIPDDPPKTDIGGFHINDNGHVFIYWKELEKAKYNGKDLHYNITVNGGRFGLIKPDELTSRMAKYERLTSKYDENYQDFEFSIYSVNVNGSSINASKIYIPTKSKRCLPPRHIKKLLHQNSAPRHAYNISWSPPLFDENISNFTVFWCRSKNDLPNQCDESIDFKHVPNNVYNYIHLTNDTLNFAVSANTLDSSSGMVWALCTALPNNDIGKLSTIWIHKMEPTFIEFKWNLNCIDRTILEGYNITYCPINDPKLLDCKEPEKYINIKGDVKSFNLTNLSPYTTYKTVIYMYSAKQYGPPSDPLVNTTLEAAPTPPRNLWYRDVTNSSVTLYWDTPEHTNGVLKYYKVWYNGISKNIEKRDTPKMEYVLSNLASYTEFDILIQACTVACSNNSNSIRIKTEIGTPGELRQAEIFDDQGIRIVWKPPKVKGGPIQYYELTAKITGEHGVYEDTVQINGTSCTMQIETCLRGSDKYEFFVRAVNVILSPHAYPIEKRSIDDESEHYLLETADSKIKNVDRRHTNYENNSSNSIQVVEPLLKDVHQYENRGKKLVCQEQNDLYLRRYIESDKYSINLRGTPSPSSFYYCNHTSNSGGLYVIIVVGLFGMAAITYVSYMVMKKFKKMKDIGVELPAGLEDIKEESKGKHLHLDCTINKLDITRSDELLCPSEQEESLLRSRMESGSSNNTENNSSCEYNEAIDDSENEQHNDDDSSGHSISDNLETFKASPTPLLPMLSPTMLSNTEPPVISAPVHKMPSIASTPQPPQSMPLSASNYVPASMLTRPVASTASNGYVSHDAIIGKPVSSGYVPWSTLGTKQSNSNEDFKAKTPIVTSTDVQGISGYVTHKQLSDFGQLMQ